MLILDRTQSHQIPHLTHTVDTCHDYSLCKKAYTTSPPTCTIDSEKYLSFQQRQASIRSRRPRAAFRPPSRRRRRRSRRRRRRRPGPARQNRHTEPRARASSSGPAPSGPGDWEGPSVGSPLPSRVMAVARPHIQPRQTSLNPGSVSISRESGLGGQT